VNNSVSSANKQMSAMLSSMAVHDFSFMIGGVAIVARKIPSQDCTVNLLQPFARNTVFVHSVINHIYLRAA